MDIKNTNKLLLCTTIAFGSFLAISAWQTRQVWDIVYAKDNYIQSLEHSNDILSKALVEKEIESGADVEPLNIELTEEVDMNILNDTVSYPFETFDAFYKEHFHNIEEVDSQWLYDTCIDFGVNPVMVLATFALETGWGTSSLWVNSNNPAGLICTDGYCDGSYQFYSDKTSGMAHMIAEMHRYIYEYNFSTVEEFRGLWSGNTDCSQFMAIVNQVYRG